MELYIYLMEFKKKGVKSQTILKNFLKTMFFQKSKYIKLFPKYNSI